MSLRGALLGLGALAFVLGVIVLLSGAASPGIYLVVIGLVLAGGVLVERSRYRPRASRPHALRPTGERFVDPASGVLTDVWEDPETGEREYRPVAGPAS